MGENVEHRRFRAERERLRHALGLLTDGGIVERVEQIGTGSVPALGQGSLLEIGLAVWPFPLVHRSLRELDALGYHLLESQSEHGAQEFRHIESGARLHIVAVGSPEWTELVLPGDYLRHSAEARQSWQAAHRAAEGGAREARTGSVAALARLVPEARRWWVRHYGFRPLERVVAELDDFDRPWYVSSGWGLDLFLGRVTRVHHDVDVVVPRDHQLALQQYLTARDWQLLTPLNGELIPLPPYMALVPPRHQIHAHRNGDFIDLLLTDIRDGVWRYRREPTILRDASRMWLENEAGTRYLAPELNLLFKSRNTGNTERPQDEADFQTAVPHLEPERRAWLRWALMATRPDHPWLPALAPT